MLLIRAMIYAGLGLILVAGRLLSAEPGFSSVGDSNIPAEVRSAAENVLELWTPGSTAPVSAEAYAHRRAWLEANLKRFPERYQINLIELDKCEQRQAMVCYLSEFAQRSSAFVLKGGVLQSVRRAFSWDKMGLSGSFARLALQWQEEMKYPELQAQTRAAIEEFIANPMAEVIFLLTDRTGAIVFNSAVDNFKFERYGTVMGSFSGRVDIGRASGAATSQKKKAAASAVAAPSVSRVYLLNDSVSLDSSGFGGLPWVMNDFAQIKIEKSLSTLETAAIEDCQPGARLFTVGYPERSSGRNKNGARDAMARELSIARGRALTMGEFASQAQGWQYLSGFMSSLRGRSVLVTDGDSERGMQGGPILTEHGKVCGILKDGVHLTGVEDVRHFQLTIPY